ncbi:HNH endonuclease [Pelagimonas varians]|uniref:HNH nuclease domain-containing protein n=1 Tax=Pelagimonas varians TaxID=696760 RepID=A0A238KH40_9RHOB|nr:HNH endonuclease [Pelagimonas varians]PYG32257.1 putative restriction endonuclease [Pelagimonas varians]SMX42159.1 hypothetical protein PEV8663_02428 [Pelagimonas varians]
MLSTDPSAFEVFSRWKDAPTNAFGSKNNPGVLPERDKEKYTLIYQELMGAAEAAQANLTKPESVEIKSMNYSPQYGSRGHRPVDVWVSICGAGSEEFARMPQIYAIASERGLEVGFAISINEDDYHDLSVKHRNRTIVPMINRKLPLSNDERTVQLSRDLELDGRWHYNTKARLSDGDEGFDEWSTLEALPALDLGRELSRVVGLFYPVLMGCEPTARDTQVVTAQTELNKITDKVDFDPTDTVDSRNRVLRQIAQRRGQKKFRQALLKAYDGACAISKIEVEAVLEAAHVTPYLGDETNDITNGILLRTDLHTLFDLHLLKIHPETGKVELSPSLASTPYWNYHDKRIFVPTKEAERPSQLALSHRYFATRVGNSEKL